jgi:diaminopimelate epimerase
MQDVSAIRQTPVGFALDTGSPHLVVNVKGLMNYDVVKEGRTLRYSPAFLPNGININFVEHQEDRLFLRTYERGVEDETLSCGTGAIASAIVGNLDKPHSGNGIFEQTVQCQGGSLDIRFTRTKTGTYQNIWLIGPAVKTFEGNL